MFYLSRLLGSPVKDVRNKSAGTLHDLVVNTTQAYPRVTAVGVRRRGRTLYAPWDAVSSFEESGLMLRIPAAELGERALQPDELPLSATFLDKQLVDTEGRKVIRVNDIQLLRNGPFVHVAAVDVSSNAILRRVGLAKVGERLAKTRQHPKPHLIDWIFLADMKRRREAPDAWFGAVTDADLRAGRPRPARGRALDPRHRRRGAGRQASPLGQPQAVQARARTRLLRRSAHDRRPRGHGEDLRAHGPPFRLATAPRPASEAQTLDYLLDRALRSQGFASLEFHLLSRGAAQEADGGGDRSASAPPPPRARRDRRPGQARPLDNARRRGRAAGRHGSRASPVAFRSVGHPAQAFHLIFGYDHRFEAYVPKEKRVLGYFALPVLVGDRVAAAIDVKADRAARSLRLQQWTWLDRRDGDKARIEEALGRFEAFQFGA